MLLRHVTIASLLTLFMLAPAALADHHEDKLKHEVELPKYGICVLDATQGNNVEGVFALKETTDGVMLQGYVTGLTPGKHGFHIHEFGDLRAEDGTAAGGHFNPHGHEHAGPDAATKHVGDLGNIEANDEGIAKVEKVIDSKLHFLLGRSLVVHAGEDDLKSQPSGDAGPRVAVGVIGIANSEWKADN